MGILVDEGTICLDKTVADYVPEFVGSGYESATVRDVRWPELV